MACPYQIRQVIYVVCNRSCTTGYVLSDESAWKYIPVFIRMITDLPIYCLGRQYPSLLELEAE